MDVFLTSGTSTAGLNGFGIFGYAEATAQMRASGAIENCIL